MLARAHIRSTSIRLLRPLRPPSHNPRLFTQNSQLLLIAKHPPRPQLPYLAQPHGSRLPTTHRLLSTETKAYVREVSIQGAKWSILIWAVVLLSSIAMEGIKMEKEERTHPTPNEWAFKTRQALRGARSELTVLEDQTSPIIDWPMVGGLVKEAISRLEDPKYDGAGLVMQGEGAKGEELLIPEVGMAGYDVEAKSYEWKTGYFQALMLAATAAEHLENMVLDKKRNLIFPKDVVIGPSNPDPRPTPVYMNTAPREEDCETFYDPPETYYMKVLTTKGFTTAQRLDAAEGYANWLEFKGLHSTAEQMYRWAIDIAIAALPNPAAASKILDFNTHIIKPTAASADLTPNLLRATTAIAIHHARNSNLSSALPILLSVLRARRAAPIAPLPPAHEAPSKPTTDIGTAVSMVRNLISPPPFPPAPPSSDIPLVRYSSKPTCSEAELMVYIGEILFASAPERASEGVGWTRQGVLVAEANLQAARSGNSVPQTDSDPDNRKCKECLLTGVGNWEQMLAQVAASRDGAVGREGSRSAGWRNGEVGSEVVAVGWDRRLMISVLGCSRKN